MKLFILILTSAWLLANGATYYIDYAGGSDSNSGTSTSAPWKRAPGDLLAEGNPLSATLTGSDVLRFKGGVIYSGNIRLNWSGSDGSHIIYDGNTDESWGSGKAIIDGLGSDGTIGFRDVGEARSNFTIQGFEIRNFGAIDELEYVGVGCDTDVFPDSGTGIELVGGGTNIVLQGLYIHNIGQWRNVAPFRASDVTGVGILLKNNENVRILDCEITKVGVLGIGLKAQSGTLRDIEVSNCNIHSYIRWAIDMSPYNSTGFISDILIQNNWIHDTFQFDSGYWTGCGEVPHTNYIFVRNSGLGNPGYENVWIDGNLFSCSVKIAGGTASVYVPEGNSANIVNNVFLNDGKTTSISITKDNLAGITNSIIRIYNNSFYNSGSITLAGESVPEYRRVYIQNNVIRRDTDSSVFVMIRQLLSDGVLPVISDNNVFYDKNFSVDQKRVWFHAGTYHTLASARTLGIESNSVYADPRYAVVSTPFTYSILSLRVFGDSPSIGFGANLSEYFIRDRIGGSRPLEGSWDAGAYIYRPLQQMSVNTLNVNSINKTP
jgi:hypothetical protein